MKTEKDFLVTRIGDRLLISRRSQEHAADRFLRLTGRVSSEAMTMGFSSRYEFSPHLGVAASMALPEREKKNEEEGANNKSFSSLNYLS